MKITIIVTQTRTACQTNKLEKENQTIILEKLMTEETFLRHLFPAYDCLLHKNCDVRNYT